MSSNRIVYKKMQEREKGCSSLLTSIVTQPNAMHKKSSFTLRISSFCMQWKVLQCPYLELIKKRFWILNAGNALKVSKYGVFSGPYFPAFGLNTERLSVSLLIQSDCRKARTKKNSVTLHELANEFDTTNM